MYKVIKRDGSVVLFDITKIIEAIKRSFVSVERNVDESILNLLALQVTSKFDDKAVDQKISVEDIQDLVENTLMEAGYNDVAKSYILYRKNHEKIRNNNTLLDYKKIVDSYIENEHLKNVALIGKIRNMPSPEVSMQC